MRRATNQNVVTISGGDTSQATTPGAFLNFGGTNVLQIGTDGKDRCNVP